MRIKKALLILSFSLTIALCACRNGENSNSKLNLNENQAKRVINIFNFDLDSSFDPRDYEIVRRTRESKETPNDYRTVFEAAKRIERLGNLTGYRLSEASKLLGRPSSQRVVAECEGQLVEEYGYDIVDSRYQPFGCRFVALVENGTVTIFCLNYTLE